MQREEDVQRVLPDRSSGHLTAEEREEQLLQAEEEKELHHSRSENALGKLLCEAKDGSPLNEEQEEEQKHVLDVSWKRSQNNDNGIKI